MRWLRKRWHVAVWDWDEHTQEHWPTLIDGPYWRWQAQAVASSRRVDEAQYARNEHRAMRRIDVQEEL